MPIPLGALLSLGLYAAAGYAITEVVERMHWPLWITLIVQFAVLGLAFVLAARTELVAFYRDTLEPKRRLLFGGAGNKVVP